MGIARDPSLVKLFLAVLSSDGAIPTRLCSILEERCGPVDFSYGPIPFTYTSFYEQEMGGGLHKSYMTFTRCMRREELPELKLLTNRVEADLSVARGRCVNLDPGYLTRDKLVLATTKDFYHRLYLGQGIFGEVTLHYRRGRYRYFSWTYPDYRDPAFCLFAEKPRSVLVKELREATSFPLAGE